MRLRRWAIWVLAFTVLGVSVAAPQPDTVLSALGIDLWPDYDRPGVLVIYRATIAPGVSLPTRLVFRIPAAAGVPSAVAERSADGQLITLAYERTVDGETAIVSVTASRPIVQLEYYIQSIERDGARRSFEFAWPGDYEVGDFSISVQQPDLAQGFSMTPAPTTSLPSVDGLTYHTLSRAGIAAGETVDVEVAYEKVSDQLTVETVLPAQQSVPAPASADGTASDDQTVLIVVAAMLAFAAVVVVALMFRSRQEPAAAQQPVPPARTASGRPARPGKGKTGAVSAGPDASAGSSRFCTQCGTAAGPDDRFCHRCGTSLTA